MITLIHVEQFFSTGAAATFVHHEMRKRPRMHQPILFPIKNPMLTLAACSAITGESIAHLNLRAEDGSLRLVFNIAVPRAQMRALRVMATSLAAYIKDGRRLRVDSPTTVRAEIADLFSPISIEVQMAHLMGVLSCSRQHIVRLEKSRCIKLFRAGRRGPGGQTRYCRNSVIDWLMRARLT